MRRIVPVLWCAGFASIALASSSVVRAGDRDAIARAFGFAEGLAPVAVGSHDDAVVEVRAAECGACHAEEHAQWQASRHAAAFSNAVFQEGLRREPAMRCVHCHAPTREQAREVAAAMPKGSFLQRRRALHTKALSVPASARAHDGVDCATCHVRTGQVLTRGPVEAEGHSASPLAAVVGDSAFCGSCHQFQFHELHEGKVVLTGMLIQSTFDEWKEYAANGGTGTCQSCHMEKDSHEVLGTRHLDFMRAALKVDVAREGGGPSALVLSSSGVGHQFPTGDVFRHLTVEVRGEQDGMWRQLAWLGRKYEPRPNETTGRTSMALVVDTPLRPFEPTHVALPPDVARYRVVYHYVSDEPDVRAALRPEDASVVLVEGPL